MKRMDNTTEIRATALKSALLCSGAGFAQIGKGRFAIATFVLTLSLLPAVATLAFWPSAWSLATALTVFLVAAGLGIYEHVAIQRSITGSPSPFFFQKWLIGSATMLWISLVICLGLTMTAFGSTRMAGTGMVPTLDPGERLIYHKYLDYSLLNPGAIIVYTNANNSAWGKPGWIMISRILAGPGDEISVLNNRYVVNGIEGPVLSDIGESNTRIEVPSFPKTLTVPEKCYFVTQDSNGYDSRVLSWARLDNIVSTKLWYLSSRGIFKPVE